MTVHTIGRRLAALEGRGPGRSTRYVVHVPADADPATIRAAVAAHQARTGWYGAVMVSEPVMSEAAWLTRYGRSD